MGFNFDLSGLATRVKHELGILDAIPVGPVPPRVVEAVAQYTGLRIPPKNQLIVKGISAGSTLLSLLMRHYLKVPEEIPAHHKDSLAKRLPRELDFKAYHLAYAALPKALQTHPIIKEINAKLKTLSIVDLYLKFKSGLKEDSAFVEHYIRPLFESLGFKDHSDDLEALLGSREARQIFPVAMFSNLNVRGFNDYESLFFGTLPFGFDWERSNLKTLIDYIPQGGVVADWGGGKGIFAHELASKRPDLKLHVVDLFSPEEIEAQDGPGPVPAHELRNRVNFITGEASATTLPEKQKADAIFSGALTPYLKDPLRLLAHLYNQLKVGGILLATIPNNMIDLTKDWLRAQTVTEQLAQNLRKMGLAVSTLGGGQIIAIERKDEREMNVIANLRHAFLQYGLGIASLSQYESIYEPHQGLWAELVSVDDSHEIVSAEADAIQADEPLVVTAQATQVEPPMMEGALVNPLTGVLPASPNISLLSR